MPHPSPDPAPDAGHRRAGRAVAPSLRFYDGAAITRESSIGWLMKQAVAALVRELTDRMTAIGVTGAQWPLLLAIAHGRQPTAADVARTLTMDAGAMTRMIDRLCEKGLVERSRCTEDRRATRLSLTDAGRLAVGPINDVLADTLNDALRGFDADEYEMLVGMLRRLLANCQDMPPYRVAAVETATSGD